MIETFRTLLVAAVVLLARLILRAVVWMKIAAQFGPFSATTPSSLDPRTATQSADIALRTCLVLCGSNMWTPHRDIRTTFRSQRHRLARPAHTTAATATSNESIYESSTPLAQHFQAKLDHPLSYSADVIGDGIIFYRTTNGPTTSVLVWCVMPWEDIEQVEPFTTKLASLMDMNLAIVTVKRSSDKKRGAASSSSFRDSDGLLSSEVHEDGVISLLLNDAWQKIEMVVAERPGTRFFMGGTQVAASFVTLLSRAEHLTVLECLGLLIIDPFVGWPSKLDGEGQSKSASSSSSGMHTPLQSHGGNTSIILPPEQGIVDAVLAGLGGEMESLTRGAINQWIPPQGVRNRCPTYILALDEGLWCGQIVNFAMKRSREGGDVKLDLYRTRHFTPSSHVQYGLPVLQALQKVANWTELVLAHNVGDVSYTPSYISNMSTPGKGHCAFHSLACDDSDSSQGAAMSLASGSDVTSPFLEPRSLGGINISGDNLSSLSNTPRLAAAPRPLDATPPPGFTLAALPTIASSSSMTSSAAVTPELLLN